MLAVMVGRNDAAVVVVDIPDAPAVICPVAGATTVAGAGATASGPATASSPITANAAPPTDADAACNSV